MSTDKFGGGMNNNISTMLQRLYKVRSCQRIVDDKRDAVFVRDIGNCANIERIKAWVTECLGVDGLRSLIDSGAEIVRVAAIDKAGSNAHFRQCVVKKVVGSTIAA